MFELIVTSFDEALIKIEQGWPTKIISLLKQDIVIQGPHHLRLSFDDVSRPVDGYVTPVWDDVEKVLEFSKDFVEDDRVLVHCLAGISRSTAVAIGILIQHGMSYEDAYNQIAMQRQKLAPNQLIIHYLDKHFGLNDQLFNMVNEKEPYPNLIHRSLELDQLLKP